ncbi:MAG: PadR family transcriptional regulator [Thermoplasmata archaeon]
MCPEMTPVSREWVSELKKGSVQLCLLALLRDERKYGFQIVKELRELSEGFFDLKEGTLYPALRRLEKKGYLLSEWVERERGIPRKYYELTEDGRKALDAAEEVWNRMKESCDSVLRGRRR